MRYLVNGSKCGGLNTRKLVINRVVVVRAVILFFCCCAALSLSAQPETGASFRIYDLACTADNTAGLHDYPESTTEVREAYEPVTFVPNEFRLKTNQALMMQVQLLGEPALDHFVVLNEGKETTEWQCQQVRGGLSCMNQPPSKILLLNTDSFRFSRASIGGWTFAGAPKSVPSNKLATPSDSQPEIRSGASLYVEAGSCSPNDPPN